MSLKFTNLYYPPDAPAGGAPAIPSGDLTKQAIEDYLSDDATDKDDIIPLDDKEDKDDKGDKKDRVEKKAKKDTDEEDTGKEKEEVEDDEDDELKEIEEALDDDTKVDDEKLELVIPARRKEILAKYPKLFKDFPYLEKAMYREQKFSEILPTIDDAKEAIEKSQTLDNFENDLVAGNTEAILKSVKNANGESFNKIVDNYLIALANVDDKAYHHVVGNVIKHTIVAMVNESRSSGNEALQNAALILNQFLFGKSTFEAPRNLSSEKKDDKSEELNNERRQFAQQRLDTSVNELNTRVNNAYKSTIENNIDPKKTMSDYVRKTASREALENLENLISKDTRFKILVDRLWDKAVKDNFNKDSVDTIKRAFLSKAKTLLPSVIKKARNEALRGMGKRVVDDKEDDNTDTSPNKRDKQDREPSRSRTPSDKVPKGMSTLEYLMKED